MRVLDSHEEALEMAWFEACIDEANAPTSPVNRTPAAVDTMDPSADRKSSQFGQHLRPADAIVAKPADKAGPLYRLRRSVQSLSETLEELTAAPNRRSADAHKEAAPRYHVSQFVYDANLMTAALSSRTREEHDRIFATVTNMVTASAKVFEGPKTQGINSLDQTHASLVDLRRVVGLHVQQLSTMVADADFSCGSLVAEPRRATPFQSWSLPSPGLPFAQVKIESENDRNELFNFFEARGARLSRREADAQLLCEEVDNAIAKIERSLHNAIGASMEQRQKPRDVGTSVGARAPSRMRYSYSSQELGESSSPLSSSFDSRKSLSE